MSQINIPDFDFEDSGESGDDSGGGESKMDRVLKLLEEINGKLDELPNALAELGDNGGLGTDTGD